MSFNYAQSTFRKLFVVAIGLTCAAVLAIGATIWWLRSEAIADASKDSNNLAVVLADQIANFIQSIDLVLSEIEGQLDVRGSPAPSDDHSHGLGGQDTYRFLMERLSHLSQAEFISLVNKNGKLVNTTQQWPSPSIDLSDRVHFQHFKNVDDKEISIIRHAECRRSSRWRGVSTYAARLMSPQWVRSPKDRCAALGWRD